MMIFKLLKQLRRRLRRKLKWVMLGLTVVIGLSFVLGSDLGIFRHAGSDTAGSGILSVFKDESNGSKGPEEVLDVLKQSEQPYEVWMQKQYVCGEEIQQLGAMSPQEIERFSMEHPEWELTLQQEDKVIFVQHIQDLSKICKEEAYFGVDEAGVLSLFDGLPQNNKVIRSFFQLNIEYLKSSLPGETVNQLFGGIRVTDLDEYNSVLSTFADYAISGSEQAAGSMGPGTEG